MFPLYVKVLFFILFIFLSNSCFNGNNLSSSFLDLKTESSSITFLFVRFSNKPNLQVLLFYLLGFLTVLLIFSYYTIILPRTLQYFLISFLINLLEFTLQSKFSPTFSGQYSNEVSLLIEQQKLLITSFGLYFKDIN